MSRIGGERATVQTRQDGAQGRVLERLLHELAFGAWVGGHASLGVQQ